MEEKVAEGQGRGTFMSRWWEEREGELGYHL